MTEQPIIGLLVRVSTQRQLGNARSEAQIDMGSYLERQGFGVRYYDEGAISGSNLSRRKVTLQMLDDLQRGEIQGIAAYDVKRLTRDEFGIDGGIIAKRCVDAGGLVVTFGKTYDLRNEDDLLHFQFQCMLAGIDWRSIRNTFWSGIFKRLESSPLFMRPPLGYMTEYIPTDKQGVFLKRPAKNPAHATLMAELAGAFDMCTSLGEVARRLRDHGYDRPPVKYRGQETSDWTIQGLRYVLTQNKIYEGIFELGGPKRKNGTARSVVWHKYARDEQGNYRVFRHEVPELAYWSPAKARAWRTKFATKRDQPLSRVRKYSHPLLQCVVCEACGAPMIGNGQHGYVCRSHRSSACRRPQKLAEHIVMALLRTVLNDALSSVADLATYVQYQLGSHQPSAKTLQLAHLEERSARLAADYASMDTSNAALLAELGRIQREIDRLREEVGNEADEREASEDLHAALEVLRNQPVETFEALAPEQQARVYAMLFRNVRIGYSGRAGARRWWLISFESAFAPGRIDVLHPHTVRILPWAISGKLGQPSLQVDPPEVEMELVNNVTPDYDRGISAYPSSLLAVLAEVLSSAA